MMLSEWYDPSALIVMSLLLSHGITWFLSQSSSAALRVEVGLVLS